MQVISKHAWKNNVKAWTLALLLVIVGLSPIVGQKAEVDTTQLVNDILWKHFLILYGITQPHQEDSVYKPFNEVLSDKNIDINIRTDLAQRLNHFRKMLLTINEYLDQDIEFEFSFADGKYRLIPKSQPFIETQDSLRQANEINNISTRSIEAAILMVDLVATSAREEALQETNPKRQHELYVVYHAFVYELCHLMAELLTRFQLNDNEEIVSLIEKEISRSIQLRTRINHDKRKYRNAWRRGEMTDPEYIDLRYQLNKLYEKLEDFQRHWEDEFSVFEDQEQWLEDVRRKASTYEKVRDLALLHLQLLDMNDPEKIDFVQVTRPEVPEPPQVLPIQKTHFDRVEVIESELEKVEGETKSN